MEESKSKNCLNCKSPVETNQAYCPHCGQKNQATSWSFLAVISTFFVNLFNVDAKLYLTLRDIWVPAKLTLAYIKGKRASYYHPMRLLLVSLFSFIGVLIYFGNFESLDQFDSKVERTKADLFLIDQLDSLKTMLDSSQHRHIDTLIARQDYALDSVNLMSGIIKMDLGRIKTKEIFQSTPEEIIENQKIDHWLLKLWIHQAYKIFKNPKGMIVYMISNMSWAVLLLILFMSLMAKLVYIRSKRYYVEHFLLYSEITSFSSLCGIILLGIRYIIGFDFEIWFLLWVLCTLIYSFLSSKKYYGDSTSKTILKFIILSFCMFFLAMLLLTLIGALAFLIY